MALPEALSLRDINHNAERARWLSSDDFSVEAQQIYFPQ